MGDGWVGVLYAARDRLDTVMYIEDLKNAVLLNAVPAEDKRMLASVHNLLPFLHI